MSKPRRNRSRAALLALVAPQAQAVPQAAAIEPSELDWAWILERATTHKVAPLLAARVEGFGLAESLAPAERRRIEAIRAAAGRHVDVARRTLSFLDESFRAAGIPYLIVKGSALAELAYPEPSTRTFSDVDVVVMPEDVEMAVGVLQGLGCRLGQIRQTLGSQPRRSDELEAARDLTRRFYERFEYELPFLAPHGSGLLPVDLHWHIAPRFRLQSDLRQVWERTRRVNLAGVEVTTLDWEAAAIHLAIHATTCPYAGFRLLHLCDVAWVAERTGDGLWDLAAKWRADRPLSLVLEMSERLFGTAGGGGSDVHRHERARGPCVSVLKSEAFLVDGVPKPLLGRLWRELRWGVATTCLRRNVVRALGVRLTRTRWRWMQWRAAWSQLAEHGNHVSR